MTAADEHYPELHRLVERLTPEQADELRKHALRLVRSDESRQHRLSFTGAGCSSNPRLAADAKQIVRQELRGA